MGLRYICILLYVKLICFSGFPEMYAQLEEMGVGIQSGHRYICILLYMKPIQCSGIAQMYGQLVGVGDGVNLAIECICTFFYILNIFGVVVLHRYVVRLEEVGMGSVCHGYVCILLYLKLMLV